MAQDTKYNEKIKKLKSERNGNRLYGVTEGLLATACGGVAALRVDQFANTQGFFPPESTAHLLYMVVWGGGLVAGAILLATACYKEIAESRRASKKIRELEKELT